MHNPVFANEEDIPMVHQDEEGYDDYNTPNTSRMDGTSFTAPDTTEATTTLRLKEKVKQDKIIVLYRHLNVTGDKDLIDLGLQRIIKKGSQFLSFTIVIERSL